MAGRIIKAIVGGLLVVGILVGMYIGISTLLNSNKSVIYFDTMSSGQVVVEDIEAEKGQTVTLPSPVRTGYDFAGWYLDRNFSSLYGKGGTQIVLNSSKVQLFAKWNAKKLDVIVIDEGALDPNFATRQLIYNYGQRFDFSEYDSQSSEVGYGFKWVKVVANVDVDINTEQALIIHENITLKRVKYAKTYDLNFVYTDGANEVVLDTKTMLFNTQFDFTDVNTVREGHTFSEWRLLDDTLVTEDMILNEDIYGARVGTITLYAQYDVNEYEVEFYTYDNVLIDTFELEYASTIGQEVFNMVEASNLITRDHYVFKGWKCGEEVVDDEFTIPAEDIILVAYYEKEKYDIKYYINFGSKMYFDTIEVEYQDTLAGTVPSDADIADLIGDNGDAYRLLSITYDNETYTKAEFEAEFTSIDSDMEILINLEKYKLFVNFYGGDGDNLYTSKQINKTQDFVLPQEPSSEYAPSSQEVGTTYEFGGWLYNGEMFDEDFDFTNIETDIDVYSEWYELNYTKWSYEMNQGTASITGYTGDYDNVCVPYEVMHSGNMADVTRIGGVALALQVAGLEGRKVLIKSNITNIGEYAFINVDSSTQIIFGEPASTSSLVIEAYAFASRSQGEQKSIASIKLPARTHTVSPLAFSNAINLVSISVDSDCQNYKAIDGVLYEIKQDVILHTYPHAKTAEEFVIPSDVTKIGDNAFSYVKGTNGTDSALKTVIDSEDSSLTIIGVDAFKNASNVIAFDFGHSSIVTISDNAFKNCFSVDVANQGYNFENWDALKTIGQGAFEGNTYAQRLFIKALNLTSIGNTSFYRFAMNRSVNADNLLLWIGGDITSIPDNAFSSSKLTMEIKPDNDINYVGEEAFKGVKITRAVFEKAMTLGVSCFDSANIDYIEFKSLYSLPADAFKRSTLTEIRIDGLNNMATSALQGWKSGGSGTINGLTTVVFGPNCTITRLGDYGLQGNTSLTSVTLCNSLQALGQGIFADCISLEEIILPDSIEEISYGAFENCINLKDINMPTSLEEIMSYAFKNCTSLEGVDIVSNLQTIYSYAFKDSALKTFCAKVTNVNENVFEGCENLISVNLELVTIKEDVFLNCTALKFVYIKFTNEGDNKINSLLNGCTNIQYFVLDGEVPTIQNVNNETLLLLKGVNTNIYIPEGTKDDYLAVTGWSEYASYLVEISVSEGIIKDGDILVKVINTNKDITIQGVTTFSDYVFAGLKSLESLNIISDSLININDISMLFYGVDVENLTIYVSNNLLSQYQNHTLWGEYEDNFVGVA